MSRARTIADYGSTGVTAAEFDFLDTTSGTPGSGTFLRGDKTWQTAGHATLGSTINHVENAVNTRVALSTSADDNLWEFQYDKTVASSNLVVTAFIPLFSISSANLSIGFIYASTSVFCGLHGIGTSPSGTGYNNFGMVHGVLTGHTTTGSQTLGIQWKSGTAESRKPAVVFCPTSAGDSQFQSTGVVATATVYEKLTA